MGLFFAVVGQVEQELELSHGHISTIAHATLAGDRLLVFLISGEIFLVTIFSVNIYRVVSLL